MSSRTSINITYDEANRSGTDTQGPPQDKNQPEMDTIENLRRKLQTLEKKYLDLTSQHSQDMSHYEKDIMKLRLELERGEALRRVLESEMSFARKDAQVQMCSAEDEICDAKAKLLELQARRRDPRQQTFTYGPGESFWIPPEENITPRGPAPDVHWGQSRHRYSTFPGSDVSSAGTLYVTCPTPGTHPASVHWGPSRHRTYTASGTDISSESIPSYFEPRGVSTPLRSEVQTTWSDLSDDVCPASWRELSDEVFTPGRPISDEVFTPARPISDEVFTPGRPISDDVFTPGTQLSDEVFTPGRPISDEVFTPGGRELSDDVFTSGPKSDWSYSRHFGPVRPRANRTADRLYYTRSGAELHDALWGYRQPVNRIPGPTGRSGRTYSLTRPATTTYVQVFPSGIETFSWTDDSSRIRPLSTFTIFTPSWEKIRAPAGTPVRPAPVNTTFRVRPRRSQSFPPFRSASQGISPNTRRIHEI